MSPSAKRGIDKRQRKGDFAVALTLDAPFVMMFTWFAIGLGEVIFNQKGEAMNGAVRFFLLIAGMCLQTGILYVLFK